MANYSSGVTALDYTPEVEAKYGMIEKVARQIIHNVTAENKLSEFEREEIENGATIEESIIQLIQSSEFDDTTPSELTTAKFPELAVKYYKTWTSSQFKTSVSLQRLRKVLLSGRSANDIAEEVAGELSQSDIYENYTNIKNLIVFGGTDGGDGTPFKDLNGGNGAIDLNTSNGYKVLLKKIKDIVAGMSYVNSDFNTSGIKRRTPKNDIRIAMSYKLKNAIDVDDLAGVFNLDKTEIKDRIIELDIDTNKVYIFDKWALLVARRLYEMTSFYVRDKLINNYWLTVERLYAISTLFDGCFFDYTPNNSEISQPVKVTNTDDNPVKTQEVAQVVEA